MSNIVILDRDGVINHDSDNYIKSVDEWIAVNGSLEAIALLHQAGFIVVVATNQSGLGRNLFSIATLEAIHKKMVSSVESVGGRISGIFYCPHHPKAGCNCRKPAPGLLRSISESLNDDLQGVPFIGDSLSDILAAENFGCEPVLVKTGKGMLTMGKLSQPFPEIFDDLLAASRSLIERSL